MEVVAERPRLVTGEDLPGESLLLGHEAKQSVEGHLLDRLRGGPVELATDVKPLGVGVDSELSIPSLIVAWSSVGLGSVIVFIG